VVAIASSQQTGAGPSSSAESPPPPTRKRTGRFGRRRPWGRIHDTRGYKAFRVFNAIALTLVVIVTLVPFVNVIARSLSSEIAIRTGRVNLIPVDFNLHTYTFVWNNPIFLGSYWNTIRYTVVSTLVAMVITTCYAYVLSKKHIKGRTFLIWIAVFTMFFNGGIVPNFILISELGLRNTIWAIALPNAVSVFNLLVMKAFFENLPHELEEAAQVDGLNTYGILLRIVLPLSKAVIATMTLFYAVTFWNSWFPALLYLNEQGLWPVTLFLRNLYAGVLSGESLGAEFGGDLQVQANVQAVTIVLISVPILMVYPFIQKYFVRGVMLGAVKG
jgi:putative aldouronate transport system permease protein